MFSCFILAMPIVQPAPELFPSMRSRRSWPMPRGVPTVSRLA